MTMDDNKPRSVGSGIGPGAPAPITEADLHAYADRQLSGQRTALVEQYLATHPQEQERVRDWQQQNRLLHRWLALLVRPLMPPLKPTRRPRRARRRRLPVPTPHRSARALPPHPAG